MASLSDEEEFYDAFESEEALKNYNNNAKNKFSKSKNNIEQTDKQQEVSIKSEMNNNDGSSISTAYTYKDTNYDSKTPNYLLVNSPNNPINQLGNSKSLDIKNDSKKQKYPVINVIGLPSHKKTSQHETVEMSSVITDSDESKGQSENISFNFDNIKLGVKCSSLCIGRASTLENNYSSGDEETKSNSSKNIKRTISQQQQKSSIFKLQSNYEKNSKLDCMKMTKENIKIHDKIKSEFNNVLCFQYISSAKIKNENRKGQKPNTSEPTWVAKFSPDGKYLAIGGVDGVLRIFDVMKDDEEDNSEIPNLLNPDYKSFVRHTFDIIDISWHKNSINILTASIDNKAILWNVLNQNQIRVFEHSDIVSCAAFHPLVDDFFASGSFDKMIRIWDISENNVVDWIQTKDLITAMTFSPDNLHLVVGFFKGNCRVYRIDQGKLKFVAEVSCKNKYSFGKLNKTGKKVTSIIFTDDLEFLVITNDSRMRLFDFTNFKTLMKYKGHVNKNLLSSASYSYEKQMIIIGSEDGRIYMYNRTSDYTPQVNLISTLRKKNRNTSCEYFSPFSKLIAPCVVWVPFSVTKKYREKVIEKIEQVYVDCLMIAISFESDIKVIGNIIELNTQGQKKILKYFYCYLN